MATISSVTAKFRQDGDAIDYTPSAAVSAGNVVQIGSLIAVAKHDIDKSAQGALAVNGVFRMPAEAEGDAGGSYSEGGVVYWDSDNDRVTPDSGDGTECGYSLESSDDSNNELLVLLQN